jgi:3-(3-hydroxy-phenyl)propionate hydroxylase
VQNTLFQWADGSEGHVNDLLRWAGGRLLLLLFGDIGAGCMERVRALVESAPLSCVQVLDMDGTPDAAEYVRDPHGHLQAACHVFGHAWALVRPDAYVAATGETVDASLIEAVGKALGAVEEHA